MSFAVIQANKLIMIATVFLDTNILLHFKPVEQIDWLKIIGVKDISIVILPITIRELQQAKSLHPKSHIRKRASKRIKDLTTSGQGTEIRSRVHLKIYPYEPDIDFAKYRLNPAIADDYLLGSIISYIDHEEPERSVLVTADDGLLLSTKSQIIQIETIQLSSNDRLQAEKSPEEKKVEILEKELSRVTSRVPILEITWEDGSKSRTRALGKPVPISDDYLENELSEIKSTYPKLIVPEMEKELPDHITLGEMRESPEYMELFNSKLSVNVITRYNEDLNDFYSRWIAYKKLHYQYLELLATTVCVGLILHNSGSIPAEDMDIEISCSRKCKVYIKSSYPRDPKAPSPPAKPFLLRSPDLHAGMLSSLNIPGLNQFVDIVNNVSDFDIYDLDDPIEIKLSVGTLKHHLKENLGELFLVFDSARNTYDLEFSYKIFTANSPDVTTGILELNVISTF